MFKRNALNFTIRIFCSKKGSIELRIVKTLRIYSITVTLESSAE